MRQFTFLRRGGLWVLAQGALMVAVVALGAVFHGPTRSSGGVILGGLLMGLGAFFGLAGSIALNKRLSPFPKPRPNAQLVQTGIYSLCRHPLYTSIMTGSSRGYTDGYRAIRRTRRKGLISQRKSATLRA